MISVSLPLPPTGLRAPGSPASGAPPGDFALALADMLAVPAAGPRSTQAALDRQIDAGPGKALPVDDGAEAIEGGAWALPTSGAAQPQAPDPPALSGEAEPHPDKEAIDPSPGKERAHARKEAIAALPLPIPDAVPPVAAPDTPPPTAIDIAAAPAPDQRTQATPHAAAHEHAGAFAMRRIMPRAASTVATIAADPAATQPDRPSVTVPISTSAPIDAHASIASPSVTAASADAASALPERFAARAEPAAETIAPAERSPAGKKGARRTPDATDARSNILAIARPQSRERANAPAVSAPPPTRLVPASAAAGSLATTPFPAKRPIATENAARRVGNAAIPGQADIAPAGGPRPEGNAGDRADRLGSAPSAPQPDAARPHRSDAADIRVAVASGPTARNAAPPAPDRIADNGIAPTQASPVAPARHPIPIAPPVAVPIAATGGGPRPVDPRAPRAGEIADAPPGIAPALASTRATPPIQPAADVQRTPLDMRRDDWTRKLIDRIEMIRDAANAADTRIKLLPDALGKIDVSMRKHGDTLHVSFTAEMPATRAMLADAQPRLAELAQERGLRLGQASVDAGTSGEGQQRPAPEPSIPARPMRAAARAEAPTETGRVA